MRKPITLRIPVEPNENARHVGDLARCVEVELKRAGVMCAPVTEVIAMKPGMLTYRISETEQPH